MAMDSLLVVHAPEIFDRKLLDICAEDDARARDSLEILQRSIDKTLEISKFFPKHKPKLVVHLGGMFLDVRRLSDTSLMMERAVSNFSRLEYSSDDIDILPENLPPRPWYLGGEWFQHGFMLETDMAAFCSYFNLGMTYDICHASLYCHEFGTDLADYTKAVRPYIRHIHISDALGSSGEGLQIGDGEIDFETLFKEIEDLEFSWVPEIWSGHLHNGAGIYECLKKLAKYAGTL